MGHQLKVTPASKDLGAGVLVWRNQVKTVNQVKNYENPVDYAAIQQVFTAKNHYKADEAIVLTFIYSFTHQARKASKEHRIRFIDRQDLQKLIDKYIPPLVEKKES